jgi:hypothetical protein
LKRFLTKSSLVEPPGILLAAEMAASALAAALKRFLIDEATGVATGTEATEAIGLATTYLD